MAHGKSLRLYLADGSPSGIRHAEIVNWTGQAIAAPRPRYAELKSWPEACRPGVYFLVGFTDDTSEGKVYIGESENVFDRLGDHIRNKEFWRECVVFSSKDQNLTKGHVKYLESRLIALADQARRYVVDNSDRPEIPSLPRADADAMEESIEFIRITLGALGYPVLEPLQNKPVEHGDAQQSHNSTLGREFTFSGNAFSARGTVSDEGFVAFAGSLIAKDAAPTTPAHVKSLRDAAASEQRMILEGDKYRLTTDMLFTSSSSAASFVAGSNRNGRDSWIAADGRSLKEIEESVSQVGEESPSQAPRG
jgi:hypothetical protein